MIMDHHDSCGKTTFTSAQLRIWTSTCGRNGWAIDAV
jgi:hypothetical protein